MLRVLHYSFLLGAIGDLRSSLCAACACGGQMLEDQEEFGTSILEEKGALNSAKAEVEITGIVDRDSEGEP